MVYSSLLFIYGFLPLSLLFYCIAPQKLQPLILFIFSMIYCGMFNFSFLVFIMAYVLINYAGCRLTEKQRNAEKCSILPYAFCVFFDTAAIFFFRSEFFEPIRSALGAVSDFFPVGISFFTLSALGTLTDVYRGRIAAEKNIISFGLYIMMFPRLIMGPVLRYSSFSRILKERKVGLCEIGKGITLFVKGLVKKVIFADSLYMLYTAVRGTEVTELSALTAWLGAVAYILCLYFTLSSFSDMAAGLGLCFGLKFPKSFNYPMFSTKIRYFYARWQTQVVKWFRKNFTYPLSSLSRNRIYKKVIFIAAWGALGFWYTFNINGFVWGILLGTAIVLEKRFSHAKMLNITGAIYTFFTVIFASVILLGDDLFYSAKYILAMIGGNNNFADALSLYLIKCYAVILLICMYASTDLFKNIRFRLEKTKLHLVFEAISPIVILFLLMACTALMSFDGSSGTMLIMF